MYIENTSMLSKYSFHIILFLEFSFAISASAQIIIRKEEPTLAGIAGGKAEWESHEQTLGNSSGWGAPTPYPNGTVFSITRDQVDNGQGEIVAGSFDSIGSSAFSRIAEYSDNRTWQPLGTGIQDGVVYSTVSTYIYSKGYTPLLFAGGTFTMAGGLSVHRIAMWDGSAWHSLGKGTDEGVDGSILAMAVIGDSLFIGGNFTHAGGKLVNHIAIWNIDSSRWEQIIDNGVVGVDGGVAALLVPQYKRIIYVGGGFLNAGSTPVSKIASIENSHWISLGQGIVDSTGIVEALCEGRGVGRYGEIIVGGHFNETQTTNLKIWQTDNSTWSKIDGFLGMQGTIYSLANPVNFYVGGDFTLSDSSKYFVEVNGQLPQPLIDGPVYALLGEGGYFPEGYSEGIYLGGNFFKPQPHFAVWSQSMDVPFDGNSNEYVVSIFPNPLIDNSTLRIQLKNRCNVDFAIYNLLGEKVDTFIGGVYDAGLHDFKLDNSILQTNNIYYARININGKITTLQLIKH